MSNLIVEIGNTAVKAAWSDRVTLGKTFRYQGEKYQEFILSLLRKEKARVMVVSSVFPLTEEDISAFSAECGALYILDRGHKELLSSCQQWAASQNCTEFASDCELDNENSLQFHLAMGFEVAKKIICFRKSLNNN